MHANQYGRFIDGGRAFEITDPGTPMPWTNVVSNGRYGFVVSQNGGGFCWLDHCQLNVISRWRMDLARDDQGRFIYVRDLDAPGDEPGAVWSLSPKPCDTAFDSYRCVHRAGSTTFETEHRGLRAEWTMCVAPDEQAEVWRVRVTNLGATKRRLRMASCFEWCCGTSPDVNREFHRLFFTTRHDADRRAVVATKNLWEAPFGTADDHWNRAWPHASAVAASGFDSDYATSDKRAFFGRYGSIAAPAAMTAASVASGGFGRFGEPIAAVGGELTLAPGETSEVVFAIAIADDAEGAVALAARHTDQAVCDAAIEGAHAGWDETLGATKVSTERSDFDLLNGSWLTYQAISARLWARTGYYQQSGAFGYRDQLQDSQVWLPIDPDRCAAQILMHAAHQFADGSVYHWWNPVTETGHKTKCSDDYLWLPFVAAAYVRETGDVSILSRVAPFVDDEGGATVLEHCRRAVELSLSRFGPGGLPLIGDMDWNDGLSAVGDGERGESVWLAMFLVEVLERFAKLLELAGEDASRYTKRRAALVETINKVAWDGSWYRRATTKTGKWLGSAECVEGQIFLNAQTWSILTGVASEERAAAAWDAVKDRLVTDYGPLLLAPAYTVPQSDVGYLTRYAPGARENGGVYMHAATWALAAACKRRDVEAVERIWSSVSPPVRGADAEGYFAEPYVLPGNVDGPLCVTPGRAGWTWYTGSAAWLNRVSLEEVVGIRPEWDGLRIDPCPAPSLGRVEVTRRWRGRSVTVRFDAAAFDAAAEAVVRVNGETVVGGLVRESDLPREGRVEVEVSWAPARAEVHVRAGAGARAGGRSAT
ncbi:MAG: glycosyl transferase [Phycisphaeraceae bacterium]|nr:MAG: glycosyl transferase [Phycisphaeraceae bacterium]